MVLLTDPLCSYHFEGHLTFNTKLVSSFVHPDNRYCWVGDRRYGEELFSKNTNVQYESITYGKRYNFREALRRFWHIFKNIRARKEFATLVFLSFENTLFPLFCLIFSSSLAGRKIICVIHNNIKTLKESPMKRILFQILAHVVKIEYIVLTKGMKDHADKILRTSTKLLYHPFYEPRIREKNDSTKSFLTLGRQAVSFYRDGFYNDFLQACYTHLENTKENIRLVLGLPEGMVRSDTNNNLIELKLVEGYIPATDYNNYFVAADFVLFPDSEEGEYRASGILIDTLSSGAIFIAPNKGHFREFDACGILYENGGFKDAILKALNTTSEQIASMRKAIEQKRGQYEVENEIVFKSLFNL